MKIRVGVRSSHLAAAVALGTFSLGAVAQSSDISYQKGSTLQEITVTAQRRSQSVLDVPMTITALPAETLEATGIETMTDLRFNTPGFLTSTGSGYVQVFISGIGNRIQIGTDPSVATFVGDTPRIYSSLVDDFSSVERVEVSKGDQGGLYGRNATAGVINIITRQPDPDAFEGKVKCGYGTKDTELSSGYINTPLSDNIALNLSATHKAHGEYLDNQGIQDPYSSYTALSAEEAASLGDSGQREFLVS